jgi:hypothetical protein
MTTLGTGDRFSQASVRLASTLGWSAGAGHEAAFQAATLVRQRRAQSRRPTLSRADWRRRALSASSLSRADRR